MSQKRKLEEVKEILTPLSQSNFKYFYRRSTAPESIEEFTAALDGFVRAYLTVNRHYGDDTYDVYSTIMFDLKIRSKIVSEYDKSFAKDENRQTALNKAAQKMWTSDESFCTGRHKYKLFSMMNEAIRMDHKDMMTPLAILTRAINKLCLYNSDVFPRKGLCFRGGGMMLCHRDFFVERKTYRVPGFLATSFSNDIANSFMERAEERGEEPVLWTVRLDGRGETDPEHRCLHVNLLEAQEFEEREFLFVPYSTFTVEAVQWSRRPTLATPHRITIFAANDNRAAPEDLPVAPWF
uniref:Mono(ADP-ribosyl)transferase n=1 Tax=Cryptomonas curvata TaxID=233186 RepID=A0A7S0QY16_9CRYP|mmetsp:Transcript_58053/g.121331  ORF Transcript_58053/g.121331 Transcript_58053/m.121331 type:complete len:294 (+) Transcript_58053:2-883(+)